MVSPIALPIARLRDAGHKVSPILGHDPIVTGSLPAKASRWNYAITLREGVRLPKGGIDGLLYRYDHDWSSDFGEAAAFQTGDDRVLVRAIAFPDPQAVTSKQLRAGRVQVEREVATLLDRIASATQYLVPKES